MVELSSCILMIKYHFVGNNLYFIFAYKFDNMMMITPKSSKILCKSKNYESEVVQKYGIIALRAENPFISS